jgi:hypothetical protein
MRLPASKTIGYKFFQWEYEIHFVFLLAVAYRSLCLMVPAIMCMPTPAPNLELRFSPRPTGVHLP